MTTTTTPRVFPFLEAGVFQSYEMHRLCDWGIVDPNGHEEHCKCPRLIHVVDLITPNVSSIDHWILEPVSDPEDIRATKQWTNDPGVIVGGLIWTEALAQC